MNNAIGVEASARPVKETAYLLYSGNPNLFTMNAYHAEHKIFFGLKMSFRRKYEADTATWATSNIKARFAHA